MIKSYTEAGYTLIAVGLDILLLGNTYRDLIQALR